MTAEVSEQSPAADARTTAGTVRGRWENGLAVFRGIPFAAPPVGEARFAAPRRAARWHGVREAFAFGSCAPQDYAVFRDQVGALPPQSTDDDWLTLNVWTPAPDRAAPRPVMVWIHGGAYKLSSSSDSAYDPRSIAREGDLVVVSCNYRLGVEGFAAIEGAPANRGLLDQVAALEWVRENIAAFGGDPGQVTVFGESAGAGSVAALLAMPSAAGLFHRAIAQSVGGPFLSPELAADVSAVIASRRGLRPTAADLAAVEPNDLAMAGEEATAGQRERVGRWGQLADHPSLFGPVVDGDVLPTTPWQALAAGAGRGVELIAGHTRDEYRSFLPPGPGAVDEREVSRALTVYGPGPDAEAAYRSAFPHASAEQLWVLVRSDWLFRMPSLRLAESQAVGGGRAHVYDLTWPAPDAAHPFGACHGLDLPLVFGDFTTGFGQLLGVPTPVEALHLAARFRTAWTAFATTGDPGWPAFDTEHRLTQVFGAPPTVAAYPEETSRQLWQDHEFPPLPLRA
ncbi:carboxylesterase/lipase family protein [Streptomyces sp. NBC_01518]|uniref:carboxylesterase/lipase family protein n=1 Tax=Streptomyces sp. NBC_01518 TaxID=2903891 RepID=UPI0038691EF9